MRYIVNLSYDGSCFCGWQIQPNAKTIQECLQTALSTLLKEDIQVVGAGRTDTGVNAIGYVAHFDCTSADIDAADFRYKLNAILPRSITIHSVVPARKSEPGNAFGEFHARFDAKRREYTYFLHRTKDPFIEKYSWQCMYDLDLDAMNKAAAMLVGRHDFSCFEKNGTDCKTSICTVFEAGWHEYTPSHVSLMGFTPTSEMPYLYFRVSADRFLRNMVRALVGTLLEVGRGKRSVESFAELILPVEENAGKICRRSLAGESVPGHALFLSGIDY